MATVHETISFKDDDETYLRWLDENPHGFLVNSHQRPKSNYLRLHRATCSHLQLDTRINFTTAAYMKTCSTSIAALTAWARHETEGGELQPCEFCNPTQANP